MFDRPLLVLGLAVALTAAGCTQSPQPVDPSATATVDEPPSTSQPPRTSEATSRPTNAESDPSPSPECGEVVSGASEPPSGGQGDRELAAGIGDGGILLYDVGRRRTQAIRGDLPPKPRQPRFRSASELTVLSEREKADGYGPDSIWSVRIGDGQSRELLRAPSRVGAYDWNTDGSFIAYLTTWKTNRVLCLAEPATHSVRRVTSLAPAFLTGTGQAEEESVAWASDFSLLILDTRQRRPTLWCIDRDGATTTSETATFGEWWQRGQGEFLYRTLDRGRPEQGTWRVANSRTGATVRKIDLPAGAKRPQLSPDGTRIAFDDGDIAGPQVGVFHASTGRTSWLTEGYAAPIWISNSEILATEARDCPPNTECNDWWTPTGRVARISIRGRGVIDRDVGLASTLQEDRALGAIDVLLQ